MTWPIVTLDEIANSVDYGLTASATSIPIGPKFLRITDIQEDGVNWNTVPFCKTDVKSANANHLNPGDIVFARTGATTGKSFLIRDCPTDAVFASYLIRVAPSNKIEPEFLAHFFQSKEYWDQIKLSARGAAQPGVNSTVLKSLKIPLPSIEDQRRISTILGTADALRTKRRAALAKLDTLAQSIFIEMFGDPVVNPRNWPVVNFGDIGKLDRGVSKHRPRNDPQLLGGVYPLIQTGDVANSGGYIRNFKSTYSEVGLRQSKMWPKGTLCITIAANIAKTGILTFDACFPDSVVGFKAEHEATVEFVRVWLSFLQKTLEDTAPESAQKNINLEILRSLRLPMPSLEHQKRFLAILKNTQRIFAGYDQFVKQADELLFSLQHRAFRGEL